MMKKISKLVFPFFIALILSLVITFPAATQFSSHFIGDGGDNYQYAGLQTLVANNLRHSKWPYNSSSLWYYPDGFQLYRGYDSVLSTLGGGLMLLILPQPVLVYNLTILTSLIFNFICAYTLFEYLSKNTCLGIIGATVFGFSFYSLARGAGHANLILIGGFPLFVYTVLKLKESQSITNFFLLGLALVIIIFSSIQYAALLIISIIFISPLLLGFYFQETILFLKKIWEQKKRLTITIISVLTIATPFFYPILSAYLKHDYVGGNIYKDFSPKAINLIIANPFLPVFSSNFSPISNQDKNIEHIIFLGWIEIVLVVLLLLKLLKNKKFLFIITSIFMFIVFTLGVKNPETNLYLPYAWLHNHFPFSVVPESGRYIILVYLSLSSFLVLALKKALFPLTKNKKYLLFLIFTGLILERISLKGYFQTLAPSGNYIKSAKHSFGKAILDIPLLSDQQANILPIFYEKSIVSGQAHWLGNTIHTTSFITKAGLNQFVCSGGTYFLDNQIGERQSASNILQNLEQKNVNTIVIHKYPKLYSTKCSNVLTEVTQLFPRIATAQESLDSDSKSSMHWSETTMKTGLFFPKKGTLKIYSLEYAPAKKEEFSITLDGKPLATHSWIKKIRPRERGESTLNIGVPAININSIPVEAGFILELTSDLIPAKQGFFTIWYNYKVDPLSIEEKSFIFGKLKRLYFDENEEVYQII